MKVRGLSAIIVAILCLALGLGTAYFLKSATKVSELEENSLNSKDSAPKSAVAKLKNILTKSPPTPREFIERKDFGESLVAQERSYTESEITNMTQAEFVELLRSTELKLPKLSDIKELPPGALHTTPAPVIQAGKDLGLLKEVFKAHPAYEKLALPFYDNCAKNKEMPTPVRALCLTNFVDIKKRDGEKVNLSEYPPTLVELTKMITDL